MRFSSCDRKLWLINLTFEYDSFSVYVNQHTKYLWGHFVQKLGAWTNRREHTLDWLLYLNY